MSERKLQFLLDEHMPVELAEQLNEKEVDTLTVRDLKKLGAGDPALLAYARNHGRVICTYDSDYVEMARDGAQHVGIVFVPNKRCEIGVMFRFLCLIHAGYSADDMVNMVEYVSG